MYDEILLPTDGCEAVDIIVACGEEHDLALETAVRGGGVPYETIIDYADENDAGLLVTSSHGRSGVSRFVFGSATERIVRLGDRSVLVISRDATDG